MHSVNADIIHHSASEQASDLHSMSMIPATAAEKSECQRINGSATDVEGTKAEEIASAVHTVNADIIYHSAAERADQNDSASKASAIVAEDAEMKTMNTQVSAADSISDWKATFSVRPVKSCDRGSKSRNIKHAACMKNAVNGIQGTLLERILDDAPTAAWSERLKNSLTSDTLRVECTNVA